MPTCLPLVKLADFGLARMRDSQTQVTLEGSVLGTPEYMSPEQARGDTDIDHRTDLYSAGVVLYEMLTGQTPFRCDAPTATIRRILDEEPRDPRKVDKSADPVLASLALRLMAKRREDRFASAGEALAALEAGRRVRSRSRRRSGHIRMAGVVGLAALVAATAWFTRDWTRGERRADPRPAPRITQVELDRHDARLILVQRAPGAPLEEFYRFQQEAPAIACEPVLIDLNGRGDQMVVAGTSQPIDDASLFAFDPNGAVRWRLRLTPEPDIAWPDLDVQNEWGCRHLRKGEFDDQPGDELAVVGAHFTAYPDRISIVDPRTQEIGPTFWHMGNIGGLRVESDFFGPGQPAIVAWASNNKLDGFDQPQLGDDPNVTQYDIVSVAMVLNPRTMNGLGPPRTARLSLPAAQPDAYAFLNLPACENTEFESSMGITSIERAIAKTDPNCPSPKWTVHAGGAEMECAQLVVDRQLNANARCTTIGGQATKFKDPEWWVARWHLLIQDGKYVDQKQRIKASPTTEKSVAPVTAVWRDERVKTRVWVRPGASGPERLLHEFPAAAGAVVERDPLLVDLDSRGNQIIVVGTTLPMDGRCVFAFDEEGRELWSLDLTPEASIYWPDCHTNSVWVGRALLKADMDGQPGDEVVVCAGHGTEYPCRVSCLDPRTHELTATFWHTGTIDYIKALPDFFGPGQPGLVAWGSNNKLDGFDEPLPDGLPPDEPARTRHRIVSVVMLLDPRQMDGLGPPRTSRINLLAAQPHACAFFDSEKEAREFSLGVHSFGPSLVPTPSDASGPWFSVGLECARGDNGFLTVDRNFNIRAITPARAVTECMTEEFWREHWRTIVQDGEYVDSAAK